MKVGVFLTILCTSLAILDRSYYDALCNTFSMQSFPSAPARKTSEKHSESYPKSITPIATLARGNASKKSMLVLPI